MNYYSHNIGDFSALTQGLDLEAVGIVIRLIDRIMFTEKPIETDWVNLGFQKESSEKVFSILKALFVETAEGWTLPELEETLKKYRKICLRNQKNGQKGGRPKKENINENNDISNEKPSRFNLESQTKPKKTLTNKPIIINKEKKETYKERNHTSNFSIPKPPDVTDQTWNDFVQLRKAKKAPVTETCIQGFRREAEKADITLEAALSVTVLHGWQGFKADWLRNKKRPQSSSGYDKPPPKTNQRYDDVCENLPDDFFPPPGAYDLKDFDLNGKLIKKEGK